MAISPISTRPKRGTTERRIILDLSFPPNASVNDGIDKNYYCGEPIVLTYPTIDTFAARVAQVVTEHGKCLLWKIDMKKYFSQLPLCPRDYSLIGIRWRGNIYFYTKVPMGLRSATYCAQRVSSAISYIHKQMMYWNTNYIDDFGGAESLYKAWASYYAMRNILKQIGAAEAAHKAVAPCTRLEFLGNVVDTEKMTLEVSMERMSELEALLDYWLNKITATKKELQSLIGKLSFVTNCVRAGRIFISRLLDWLRNFDDTHTHNDVPMQILGDLKWWKSFLRTYNGVSILWLTDNMGTDNEIATDASMVGAGAIHKLQKLEFFHHKFDEKLLQQISHISQLEMFTVVIAIKLWKEHLQGHLVRLSVDNQACLFAINKGRTKDEFMIRCLRELAWICCNYNILVKVEYINTKRNILPDLLSRWYSHTGHRRKFMKVRSKNWVRKHINETHTQLTDIW